MSRFMVETVRLSFLVVALLVIGAAEPGALAQPGGDTGAEVNPEHDCAKFHRVRLPFCPCRFILDHWGTGIIKTS